MKLYRKIPKRIAKKKIGCDWKKFQAYSQMKPGDLVNSCSSFNDKVVEIKPRWSKYGLRKGKYICDFNMILEHGSCSAAHCCTFPLPTQDQIIEDWKFWATPDGLFNIGNDKTHVWYQRGLACVEGRGKEIVDELGQCLV